MASEPVSMDKLHDIILPAVERGLPAPGWWLLTIAGLLVCFALIAVALRYYLNGKPLREASRCLQDLGQQQPLANRVIAANTLLKRCALAYYPREQVAALNGTQWWLFLDAQLPPKKRTFSHQQQRWEGALYGDDTQSEQDFVNLCQSWLKLGLRKTRLRLACGLKSSVNIMTNEGHQA